MRKNQTRVQGPRIGTIRANDARDLREYYKGFRRQFRHEYFAKRADCIRLPVAL